LWDGIFEQFFDYGEEVVKGANGAERWSVGGAVDAAGRGEQERGFDHGEWDLSIAELANQAQVESAETARGVREAEVKIR
jgi:hypothetical protein